MWVSKYFGNNIDWGEYNTLALNLQSPKPQWDVLIQKKYVQKALDMRQEKHFFHWELEFPEVFYNEQGIHKENAGFDAVIGNPPYDVIAEKEQGINLDNEKSFFRDQENFIPALGGKLNFYKLFSALSISLTRANGNHGFIVPMAIIGDEQAELLRKYILNHMQLTNIEVFPQKDDPKDRVFEEAKLPTCIYILKKTSLNNPFLLRIHKGKYILETSTKVMISKIDIELLDPIGFSIPSMPGITANHILLGINLSKRSLCHHLGEVSPSQQGEVNLTTHCEFLSNEPVGPEVLRGAHVDRYQLHTDAKQGIPAYIKVSQFL